MYIYIYTRSARPIIPTNGAQQGSPRETTREVEDPCIYKFVTHVAFEARVPEHGLKRPNKAKASRPRIWGLYLASRT